MTIPAQVTTIYPAAFYNNSSLTEITCYAEVPPAFGTSASSDSNPFEEVNKASCTLKVPAASVDAYKAADTWKEFNIVAMSTTGVKAISTSAEKQQITRYDLSGRRVNSGYKGIVIVKMSDGSIHKVMR